jgi:hypothetical protein
LIFSLLKEPGARVLVSESLIPAATGVSFLKIILLQS